MLISDYTLHATMRHNDLKIEARGFITEFIKLKKSITRSTFLARS